MGHRIAHCGAFTVPLASLMADLFSGYTMPSGQPKYTSASSNHCSEVPEEGDPKDKHSPAQPAPLIVSPIFRYQDGSPISHSRLASILKHHLTLTGHNASHYNTHSFRQGQATDMAKKGYTETQVASVGRWKSNVPRVCVKPDTVYCGSL